jgi:hypothetical protein
MRALARDLRARMPAPDNGTQVLESFRAIVAGLAG